MTNNITWQTPNHELSLLKKKIHWNSSYQVLIDDEVLYNLQEIMHYAKAIHKDLCFVLLGQVDEYKETIIIDELVTNYRDKSCNNIDSIIQYYVNEWESHPEVPTSKVIIYGNTSYYDKQKDNLITTWSMHDTVKIGSCNIDQDDEVTMELDDPCYTKELYIRNLK